MFCPWPSQSEKIMQFSSWRDLPFFLIFLRVKFCLLFILFFSRTLPYLKKLNLFRFFVFYFLTSFFFRPFFITSCFCSSRFVFTSFPFLFDLFIFLIPFFLNSVFLNNFPLYQKKKLFNVSLFTCMRYLFMSSFCSSICSSIVFFFLLSIQQPRLLFFWKRSFLLLPVFSLHQRKLCHWKFVLTHFETSVFELFTFTSTNSTFSLLECLLCLFISSFCSSSIHLFSLLSRRVFSFLSLFSLFLIFFFSWTWIVSLAFFFCFLLFTKTILSVSLLCWRCFTFIFPALYCFSVSWEMVSRFCLNSPFLFSLSSFQHSVSHLLPSCFDVSEKMLFFFQRIGEDIFCFFLSAIFLFFFFCSLVFFSRVCDKSFYFLNSFWNCLLILFLSSLFYHEKSAQKPSFFVSVQFLFCFTFASNIFPCFLSSLFLSYFSFHLFVHPFLLFSLFLFSPFSILSLFLYLSVSFTFVSIAVVAYPLFVLTHFSSVPLLWSWSLCFLTSSRVFFLHLRLCFFPKKISKLSVVNFLKMKLCLYFLNPPVICVKSRVFFLLASSFFLVCSMFLFLRFFIVTFLDHRYFFWFSFSNFGPLKKTFCFLEKKFKNIILLFVLVLKKNPCYSFSWKSVFAFNLFFHAWSQKHFAIFCVFNIFLGEIILYLFVSVQK